MTRPNSVEIGGRDSRTTSSTAWRNDEPARRALAIRVIVSGSCLLNEFEPARLPAAEPEARQHEPDQRADEEHDRVAQAPGSATENTTIRIGTPIDAGGPDHEVLADLEPQVRAGDLAGEVRPEVALLDDLVELGHGRARLERLGEAALAAAPAAGVSWRVEA